MTSRRPSTDASPGADAARPVFLSNGTYTCFFTPAGTGFSSLGDCQLTSWRDDPCEDDLGFYVYVRDRRSGAVTTACGAVLAGQERGRWEVEATAGGAAPNPCGRRVDAAARGARGPTVERRRLRLRNAGREPRELELTSYVEVVLNDRPRMRHPGFSKLFVETAWNPDTGQLRATRRPRANSERHPTLALTLRGAPILEWNPIAASSSVAAAAPRIPARSSRPHRSPAGSALCSTRSSRCARTCTWRRGRSSTCASSSQSATTLRCSTGMSRRRPARARRWRPRDPRPPIALARVPP